MNEQVHPQLGLQLENLPAHRRLRNMQRIRRFGNMLQLRDLDEILDLPQFHVRTSPNKERQVFQVLIPII
ncbi:hypothetical protein D1872_249940 [compost metagenome]